MNKKKIHKIWIAAGLLIFTFSSIYWPGWGGGKTGSAAMPASTVSDYVKEDINIAAGEAQFTGFNILDIVLIIAYAVGLITLAMLVSRVKKGHERNAEDYFLAGKKLPWWAIGSSLIAANISAEQFVGMSGSGFAIGLAIATYEWMAAITLIIVGKFFLPIFIQKGIYTIPEFIEARYNKSLKTILAVFWLGLFVFVNLTSVLYLGALAMQTITGMNIWWAVVILSLFALAYSIWGGLSAVAWTDAVQVFFLILGGILTTIIALKRVSLIGDPALAAAGADVSSVWDGSAWAGFKTLFTDAQHHLDMILEPNDSQFRNLPGIAVLVGGMWITNIYYWGFNQYIIQRTFAAKNLKEAQRGIAFAAVIKLIIPLIVVIPGIAGFLLAQKGVNPAVALEIPLNAKGELVNDRIYPLLLDLLPHGFKGLAFVALIAAIVSSLASMLNSIATIFTMDIYQPFINKKANNKHMVNTGRVTAIVAMLIGGAIAPLLGGIDQAFQYIQEFTGLVSPGILAIFILGLFWKKTTSRGAIAGAVTALPIALFFKIPRIALIIMEQVSGKETADVSILNMLNYPFLNQMGLTALITGAIIVGVSLAERKKSDEKAIDLNPGIFKTGTVFNSVAIGVMITLAALYTVFFNETMIATIFG